jgi:hypothetical protein
MAVTNEKSAEFSNMSAFPPSNNPVHSWHGRMRIAYFKFTQGAAAGDANSTAELVRLPQGSVRVIGHLSKIAFSAFGAARTLDIGTRAYKDLDGVAVAEAAQAFASAVDVSAAGSLSLEESAAAGTHQAKLLVPWSKARSFTSSTKRAIQPMTGGRATCPLHS